MARLAAGDLNQRITLRAQAGGQDAQGAPNGAWADVVTVWAAVLPLRGRELIAAEQAQYAAEIRFRIRYRAGVDNTMRVTWRGEEYDITAVIEPDGAKEQLEILAVRGLRAG